MAFLRSAQRTYERSALEVRFENFDFNWESKFTPAQLFKGRFFYRTGLVKTLEVHKNYASASLKIDENSQPYCVIDFSDIEFSVRGSSQNDDLNAACAVACMYELEELLADEIPAVKPYCENKTQKIEAHNLTKNNENQIQLLKEQSMPLVLQFNIKKDSLAFSTFWKSQKGLLAAFGTNSIDASHLNNSEREKLIRLASFARKSHFSYNGKFYSCDDSSTFANFVSAILPQWKKIF